MNVHIEGEGTVSTGEERTRTASIRDVARAADVSYQTVSRVLNGHPSIRPETKQRVLDAMAELRYRPNQAARALVTSRSRTIGVILGSRGEYGPTSSLAALEDAARARGYWVITSVKAAGKDIATFTVTGQDSEVESVKSIMAGEQYSTINKDTSLLVAQTIKMIQQLQKGEEVDVNDTEQYDNGVKVVPAYLLDPVIVTKENAAEAYANNPNLLEIVKAAQ